MSDAGLIVIGGLPATGKTSIARPLARRLNAAYLRINTIEQSLIDSGELVGPVGVVGYSVAGRLAIDQTRAGLSVVVECVNPLTISRHAWRDIADECGTWTLEVETICPDVTEHRRRVEQRTVGVPGLVVPTWAQVVGRDYEPWDRDHLVVDTSVLSVDGSVARIAAEVDRVRHRARARRQPVNRPGWFISGLLAALVDQPVRGPVCVRPCSIVAPGCWASSEGSDA